MDKALVLKNVSFRSSNRTIFTDLNLEVDRGEVLAICGTPSGNLCKFEDLLLRNFGDRDFTEGSIIIDAAETEKLPYDSLRFLRMVNIGVLPKNASVGNLKMTVRTYLLLPFRESIKKSERDIILDAKRIMELLGVSDTEAILQKKVSRLSPNDLRAVLYAAALSTDPAVALCHADINMADDEKESFFTLLIKICKIKKIALILLTTDTSFAKTFGERVYCLQNTCIVPYTSDAFLDSAAAMLPIEKNEKSNEDVIRVSHIKATRQDEKLDFTLYKKEVVSLSIKKGELLFLGKRKPFRGNIYAENIALQRNKNFQKSIMHVTERFPFVPVEKVGDLLAAFSKRPSLKEDMGRILDFLPLPDGFAEKPLKPESLFETLYLGLLCAAMSEAKLILLSDIDLLTQKAEKYELITLLSAICKRTGAAAVIFSCDDAVHKIVSSGQAEESTYEERTNAYADAT